MQCHAKCLQPHTHIGDAVVHHNMCSHTHTHRGCLVQRHADCTFAWHAACSHTWTHRECGGAAPYKLQLCMTWRAQPHTDMERKKRKDFAVKHD